MYAINEYLDWPVKRLDLVVFSFIQANDSNLYRERQAYIEGEGEERGERQRGRRYGGEGEKM